MGEIRGKILESEVYSPSMSDITENVTDSEVLKILSFGVAEQTRSRPTQTVQELTYAVWQRLLQLRRWTGPTDAVLHWKPILGFPETPLDQNYNLMAAEHYAYARHVAQFYGDPNTNATIKLYFDVKNLAQLTSFTERLLRTDPNHPTLPESAESRQWAARGAVEGLDDYRKEHEYRLGTAGSSREIIYDLIKTQAKAKYSAAK
jgi:hypothetical protein